MSSSKAYLPNGQRFDVIPVFGGFSFKSIDLNTQQGVFPPGWTIILQTQKPKDERADIHRSASNNTVPEVVATTSSDDHMHGKQQQRPGHHQHSSWSVGLSEQRDSPPTYRFTKPTLQNDFFYISSISMPSNDAFKPASSPTRQIAMLVWATLWWYFHLPEPNPHLTDPSSHAVPEPGLPKGDWRINIKRDGVFKGRNLLQKLERMGLITNEDSSVGLNSSELRDPTGWSRMFSSRRGFWQIDARVFLFTLPPANASSPFPSSSPRASRSASPCKDSHGNSPRPDIGGTSSPLESLNNSVACYGGPFTSGSHLPTYFPPQPLHYVVTDGIRHPMRQKPPRQGEIFYVRYIPSVEQYLSFRVPILSTKDNHPPTPSVPSMPFHMQSHSPTPSQSSNGPPSDLETLHRWMNIDRVNAAWGVAGPHSVQEQFLRNRLSSRNSFPVLGCWDNRPFGYFEIYWVKEDPVARPLGGYIDNWDRGLHCLVGEEEFRGPHRVAIWLSALVHYCWLADMRTQTVLMEPRVDNERYVLNNPFPS